MNRLPTESSRLLRQRAINEPSPSQGQQENPCSCKHLCLPSKPAILIIFWTAVVGAVYNLVLLLAVVIVDTNPLFSYDISTSANECLPYVTLAFISLFYPLSGFIADVCCGRLKVVAVSLCFILTFVLLSCFSTIVVLTGSSHSLSSDMIFKFHETKEITAFTLILVSLIIFFIGLAGYQANVIQLGLDQLFEAPSQYLSLFILYASWAFTLGSIPVAVFIPLLLCNNLKHIIATRALILSPFVIGAFLILLLIISWWKRHCFYTDRSSRLKNPYTIVFKVISFARKHKHPLRPSAFTYCDNYIPSRIDFAKERYGGPFTTEQVENVKTFLRILLILFSIGPVFTLEVPASYFIFPIFGFHALQRSQHNMNGEFCTGHHIVVGTGTIMILSMLVLFPVYMSITCSIFRKKMQKIFQRMLTGTVLCLAGVASLLIIDTIGHSLNQNNIESDHSQCAFQFYMVNGTLQYPALDMHWSVLIPPSLCLGVGPLIIMTATLEFISAQSPQLMKGFLIGLFFAIRGLFQLLNSLIIFPLSLKHPWASGEMLENPPVTNCGFVYLLFTCVVGLTGLILFSVAAKQYKYRQRDEGMFRQMDIEDVFEREIEQTYVNSVYN